MAVHVHDLKDVTECLDPVAFGRNPAKGTHDKAGDRGEAARTFAWETTDDAGGFAKIVQRYDRIYDPAPVFAAPNRLGLGDG